MSQHRFRAPRRAPQQKRPPRSRRLKIRGLSVFVLCPGHRPIYATPHALARKSVHQLEPEVLVDVRAQESRE
jgi:hypothetical protein